jgi:hypothetical protein
MAVAACGKSSNTATPRLSGVKTYKHLSTKHNDKMTSYPQKPPVGGAHASVWLKCAVWNEEVPASTAVHSLEHGAVWISYQPGLAAADVTKLAALHSLNPNYVLVTPFSGQPAPVEATAWGLQLEATGADDPRLSAFIKAYAGGGQGGEGGADCAGRGLTPTQAKLYLEQANG